MLRTYKAEMLYFYDSRNEKGARQKVTSELPANYLPVTSTLPHFGGLPPLYLTLPKLYLNFT